MARIRSGPRWMVGVLAGLLYAALWWGAVVGALWLAVWRADPPDRSDVVSMTFETVEVGVYFLFFVIAGLVLANTVWAVGFLSMLSGRARPGRIPFALGVVVVVGVALPLASARAASPLDRVLLVAATAIVPAVAAWWLASARPPAPEGG